MLVHPSKILSKEDIYSKFGLNPSDKIESDCLRNELIGEIEKQRELISKNRKSLRSESNKNSEKSHSPDIFRSNWQDNLTKNKHFDYFGSNDKGSNEKENEKDYYDAEEYKDREENNSRFSSLSRKNEESLIQINELQKSEVKAYDSDPEYERYQKGERRSKKSAYSLQNSPKSVSFHLEQHSSSLKATQTKKYTIPEPFSFDNRKLNGEISITKKKFFENMEIKRLEEKKLLSYQFRARKIPEVVLQRDLYKKIMTKNEERRAMVKKNSIALTLQNERPFSFYIRDKNKGGKKNVQERKQYKDKINEFFSDEERNNEFIEEKKSEDRLNPFNFKFKANPVPWFCSIPLYKEIISQEKAARDERIAAHAQELMAKSKLPPRMEKHEQKKKLEEKRIFEKNQKQYSMNHLEKIDENPEELKKNKKLECNSNFTFHPVTKTKIPDFSRLHKSFQNLLETNRQNKRNTIINPFNFQKPRLKKIGNTFLNSEHLNNTKKIGEKENSEKLDKETMKKRNPLEKWQKIKYKTQGMPSSTKKWEEAAEKKRREKEKREIEKKEKEFGGKADKEEKISELKARLLGSPAILEYNLRLEDMKNKSSKKNKQELLQQKKVEDEQKEKWKKFMEELKKKPLLVETYNEKNLKKKRRTEELKKVQNAKNLKKHVDTREGKEEKLAHSKEQQNEEKNKFDQEEYEIDEDNEYENEKFEDD